MQKSKIAKIENSKNFWPMFRSVFQRCFLPKRPSKEGQIMMKKIWQDSLAPFRFFGTIFREDRYVKFRENEVQKMVILWKSWIFRSIFWFMFDFFALLVCKSFEEFLILTQFLLKSHFSLKRVSMTLKAPPNPGRYFLYHILHPA